MFHRRASSWPWLISLLTLALVSCREDAAYGPCAACDAGAVCLVFYNNCDDRSRAIEPPRCAPLPSSCAKPADACAAPRNSANATACVEDVWAYQFPFTSVPCEISPDGVVIIANCD